MADKCSIGVNLVFKSSFFYEMLVSLSETNEHCVSTTQFLSFLIPPRKGLLGFLEAPKTVLFEALDFILV